MPDLPRDLVDARLFQRSRYRSQSTRSSYGIFPRAGPRRAAGTARRRLRMFWRWEMRFQEGRFFHQERRAADELHLPLACAARRWMVITMRGGALKCSAKCRCLCATGKTSRTISNSRSDSCWSGRRDSNPRPSAPKADALPGCATPRSPFSIVTRIGFSPGQRCADSEECRSCATNHAISASLAPLQAASRDLLRCYNR